MDIKNKIIGALVGTAVGDALGVPVEFKSREKLRVSPVTDFTGYGSWNQPPGTWSDDSSLAFCLAESLCSGYDLEDIALRFTKWYIKGYWGAHHQVFDIGNATRASIERLMAGEKPYFAGEFNEYSNGNGSLMRILPIAFYLLDKSVKERYQVVKEVSSITHRHFRSVFSCFIYIEYVLHLIKGLEKLEAYVQMQKSVAAFIDENDFNPEELIKFDRVLKLNLKLLKEDSISSSGYVIHSLESSLWCFLNSSNYAESVLKAVNLGDDTDTTAAITGGLSGIYFGLEGIRKDWIEKLARKDDVVALGEKLHDAIFRKNRS